MTFAAELHDSLHERTIATAVELAIGEPLENVLERHLVAVESAAETELLTSILLLDADRKRLRHAAAPSLPKAYCKAIDGSEIGPAAGSCGTAAYLGRAIYVTDIATDPLWRNYRDVALPHGLRACWSTPIQDSQGDVVGTFAIYHLTSRSPTRGEVDAIAMITDHVAQAIEWSRGGTHEVRGRRDEDSSGPLLRLVSDLDRERAQGQPTVDEVLSSIEANFDEVSRNVDRAIEKGQPNVLSGEHLEVLLRVKRAAERGAALARTKSKPD